MREATAFGSPTDLPSDSRIDEGERLLHERRLDLRVGPAGGAFLKHGDDGAQSNLSGRPHVSRSGGFGKSELVNDVLVHERDLSPFARYIEPLDDDRTRGFRWPTG